MRATKAVFKEEEFSNKYKHISSAILEDASSCRRHNKLGNSKVLRNCLTSGLGAVR